MDECLVGVVGAGPPSEQAENNENNRYNKEYPAKLLHKVARKTAVDYEEQFSGMSEFFPHGRQPCNKLILFPRLVQNVMRMNGLLLRLSR